MVLLLHRGKPQVNIENLISGEFHSKNSDLAHIKIPFRISIQHIELSPGVLICFGFESCKEIN